MLSQIFPNPDKNGRFVLTPAYGFSAHSSGSSGAFQWWRTSPERQHLGPWHVQGEIEHFADRGFFACVNDFGDLVPCKSP